jgi:hypothetical protein
MQMNFISPRRNGLLACLLFCLTGCAGWHMANSVSADKQMTVSIPYAKGDDSGELTSRIVEAVNNQPGFFVDESGQYLLQVRLLDDREEKIGFRYNPRKLKKGVHKLILEESRAKALAEVSLVDRFTKKTVAGPAYILGNIDYDHQENTVDNDINDLSLGQLSDIDTAQDVTYIPLYRDLAAKIALWLQNQQDLRATAIVLPPSIQPISPPTEPSRAQEPQSASQQLSAIEEISTNEQ